jgi:glycosyl transferase, family 25
MTYSGYMNPPLFDAACVINLNSRPDRWAKMELTLAKTGIQAERFPAVGIEDLQGNPPPLALRAFLSRVDGERPDAEHKLLATWACLNSHLAVIRHARAHGWKAVLILEDDCEFRNYAPGVLQRLPAQLQQQEWDLLYLGGTFKKKGQRRRLSSNLMSVDRVRLAHAYIVKAPLYERILAEAPASGLPIDWYYSEKLLSNIHALMVEPVIAYQRQADMSDIEQVERKPKLKLRKMLKHLLATLRYGRLS